MSTIAKSIDVSARPKPEVAVLAKRSGETLLLLHSRSGEYFTLDEVGATIWSLCGDCSIAEISDRLAAEYDAPRDVIEEDVLALVATLVESRLLRLP